MLKPNFEQSKRRLKSLCIWIHIVLWAERKLLHKTCQWIYHVSHILSGEQNDFLDSGVGRFGNQILKSASPFVKQVWQKVVTEISVQKIALLCWRLLASALNQHLVHVRVNKCLRELFGGIDSRLITCGRKYVPSLSIFRIDFDCLFTMSHNVCIVFVAKLHAINSMLGRLFVLKLPKTKLLVTNTQQLGFNFIWLFEQIEQ